MKQGLEVEGSGPMGTGARCRECGSESPAEARFCIYCGAGLTVVPDTWRQPSEEPADPLVGRVVAGRYRVIAHLGSGGMGVVYRVEHVNIGKVMALKVLHEDLARRPDVQRRFRREAEAASRLASAHTVQVFDFGESDGRMYLVMEYVEGENLDALVEREGPLAFPRAARLVAQVCASVAEAHALGIVHRDLKPENVMIARIDGRETAKVLDFGLAKLRFDAQATTVTTMGLIVGTPEYMSPEQIRGEPVDARGDVYAVGALLYHVCTGRPPFEADSPFAVLTKHLTDPLVPPSHVAPGRVPPEADAIIGKAMAKNAADRYGSAGELRAELVGLLRRSGEDLTEPALRLDSEPERPSPSRPRLRVGTMDLELERRGRGRGHARVQDPGAPPSERAPAQRRGRLLLVAKVALGLGVLSIAGVSFLRPRDGAPALDPSVEHEPNDDMATAGALPARVTLLGHVGQRSAPTRGDVDHFRLVGSEEGAAPIRIEVGGIPNMDIVLEVLEEGSVTPRFVIDGGGVGEGEIAPNLPARGKAYVARVHERVAPGAYPGENVSDRYSLRWQRARVAPTLEREPNDALETAQPIALGGAIEGYLGYTGDVDVYCLRGAGGPLVARASGLPQMDLVVRVVDRALARSRRVNARGNGEGEVTETIADAREGQTCFEVSAQRRARAASEGDAPAASGPSRSSRGDARYALELVAAPPEVGVPGEAPP